MRTLTPAAARRIALAAQGFGRARPERAPTMRDLQRVVDTVGLVQIDSVNVVTRSHYLPFFSRLGPYDPALLDRMRDRAPRRLVEYWAHEASLLPPSTWPLMEHPRMRRALDDSWGGIQRVAREHPELVAAVREEVEAGRPRTAREIEAALGHERSGDKEHWGWNWSLVKHALEHLFWAGAISSAGRTQQFERRYAALARVVPPREATPWLDPSARPSEEAAYTELVRISARATGVATEADLADYFRLKRVHVRPAIERLVAAGELEAVEVRGWGQPAWLHAGARRPRAVDARALLSPFDSLVWCRPRVERIFDFHYRIEIYTPAEQRVHGYYVLPFLLGDALVGRVDLKADRAAGALLARQVTWEPGRGGADDRRELGEELGRMATWLGLTQVVGA
ncbi:winged helix DNA-binding domain-containing protein [Janibacter sp. CX7]|uniref:winged helix-turn-helix domain-containing protein n=1 Tax=Janibacter sp. CX7 TaxID=2963431 RepID=UPI0020CDED74|nr:crosslink repair DNA glycosylase YcaQ family protein [Janibacter sp. CX7]UTT65270.1 winged helix DNA-binding domain-containing protein [Janibacter sp. CX7]